MATLTDRPRLHTDNGLDRHVKLPREINARGDLVAELLEKSQSVRVNLDRA
ncbi:MAG: hypothetical protein OEN50_16760 [Deltaproteobacteria bacterium]|nr:hypothetical protein [Deltaproteobacteria bacterium]